MDGYSYPSLAGMLTAPVESRNNCELMLYIMDFHRESKFTLIETLVSNGAVHLGVYGYQKERWTCTLGVLLSSSSSSSSITAKPPKTLATFKSCLISLLCNRWNPYTLGICLGQVLLFSYTCKSWNTKISITITATIVSPINCSSFCFHNSDDRTLASARLYKYFEGASINICNIK